MKERWFLIGDIHGEAGPIARFIKDNSERLDLRNSRNYIILLGDVACNYHVTGHRDDRLKRKLNSLGITCICLRGNHEARVTDVVAKYPERWDKVDMYGGKVYIEKEYQNIHYLEDGPAVYNFNGYKTLCIPGAYSVDKYIRLRMGWEWFPGEQLSEEEMEHGRELVKEHKSFDLILSHTCPIGDMPTELFIPSIDQSTVDHSMEIYLGEIATTAEWSRFAWGHFHADKIYPMENGREKIMLLNEKVVDLDKYMKMQPTDYWAEIMA